MHESLGGSVRTVKITFFWEVKVSATKAFQGSPSSSALLEQGDYKEPIDLEALEGKDAAHTDEAAPGSACSSLAQQTTGVPEELKDEAKKSPSVQSDQNTVVDNQNNQDETAKENVPDEIAEDNVTDEVKEVKSPGNSKDHTKDSKRQRLDGEPSSSSSTLGPSGP